MTRFVQPAGGVPWRPTSDDPNDEQFGDVVTPTTPADADAFDAVLVGEPYDRAVIGRRGAADGPRALREALRGVKTHHFDAGPVADAHAAGLGDLGDVEIPTGDVARVQNAVAETAVRVYETGALPVFLGGDNSLTYANVRPLLDRGRVGVLNFDAHLDVREVRETPTSGTPYRQLLEEGLDAYACVGARHFETSTEYVEYVESRGGAVVTAEAVGRDGDAALAHARDALADVEHLYVSVDLDVLDGAAAPGVSAPTPGGLSTRELFGLVRSIASDERVAGFEIVECAPPLDTNGRTSDAGARTVAHFLSGHQT
jgi:formiminoglutamase/agmatinase